MQLLEIFRPREQVPRLHQIELTLNNIRSDSEPKELPLKEFDEYDEYDEYEYSQLSRKRPPLVHDKVVAYGRWSLTRKINKISLILD